MRATNFHTHTKQEVKEFFMSLSLYFWTANWKTKDSASNSSKRSLTSVYPLFLHGWKFDFLELFQNIWNVSNFQRIYYLPLRCNLALSAVSRQNYTLTYLRTDKQTTTRLNKLTKKKGWTKLQSKLTLLWGFTKYTVSGHEPEPL